MLAIQEEEIAVVVLAMVGGIGIAIVGMVMSFKSKSKRLAVIERALRDNHQLDEPTKRALTEELTGRKVRDPSEENWRNTFGRQLSMLSRNFLFVLGWMGLFTGIGLMVTGAKDLLEAGAIVACIGFGLVTVPLALRELESREQTNRG